MKPLSLLLAGLICSACVSGVDTTASPLVAADEKPTDATPASVVVAPGAPSATSADDLLPPATPAILSKPAEPNLAKRAAFAEAMQKVEERQRVFDDASELVELEGAYAQGGLLFGRAPVASKVTLDGAPVMVDDEGRFVLGFGRDSALSALLVVSMPNGKIDRRALEIEDREFKVDRIDGLDQSKVSGFTEAQLEKIGQDSAKKKAARKNTQTKADWLSGFDWPVRGRISGVFGSQRILNGEPKRPHSGVDVAVPTGTPIKAPADGVVSLAETGMYFEGGLVLLDHGHWLESAFLHMSRIDVEPGQRVKKGDVIGAVGATGRVTGPHLHWSVKWTGRLVDPQLLVGEMSDK